MSRPLTQAVTAGVSERLESAAASLEHSSEAPASRNVRTARQEAMSLGTAVHRALETWDLDSPIAQELERQQRRLGTYFPDSASGTLRAEASR